MGYALHGHIGRILRVDHLLCSPRSGHNVVVSYYSWHPLDIDSIESLPWMLSLSGSRRQTSSLIRLQMDGVLWRVWRRMQFPYRSNDPRLGLFRTLRCFSSLHARNGDCWRSKVRRTMPLGLRGLRCALSRQNQSGFRQLALYIGNFSPCSVLFPCLLSDSRKSVGFR